jgi:hypothetical protein
MITLKNIFMGIGSSDSQTKHQYFSLFQENNQHKEIEKTLHYLQLLSLSTFCERFRPISRVLCIIIISPTRWLTDKLSSRAAAM